jgi:hypothetical protein
MMVHEFPPVPGVVTGVELNPATLEGARHFCDAGVFIPRPVIGRLCSKASAFNSASSSVTMSPMCRSVIQIRNH